MTDSPRQVVGTICLAYNRTRQALPCACVDLTSVGRERRNRPPSWSPREPGVSPRGERASEQGQRGRRGSYREQGLIQTAGWGR
jgi:hypothetical protein